MDSEYLIIDPRPLECFKEKTFSGFKKKDIIKELLKTIENKQVESACFWITECIISGYTQEIFEKIINLSSKIVHINNPNLPSFLLNRLNCFLNSISGIDKNQLIHIRNTLSVRNCLFDVVVTIALSEKTKQFSKHPKLKDDDFYFNTIKKKLNATMQILPSHIIKFTDPEELRIIMNEFFFNLKNKLGGYENACYWVSWLLEWEKINKKKKLKFEIEDRNIKGVNQKYSKDLIWLVWSVIFEEGNLRDNNTKREIQSLFILFKNNYTNGKRKSRIPIIYHAIGYLTLPIKFNRPARSNLDLYIQTQCNINRMFQNCKKYEIKEYNEEKPIQGKTNAVKNEITSSNLDRIKEIDEILFNSS